MRRLALGIASALLLISPAAVVAVEPSTAVSDPVSQTRAASRGVTLSAPASAPAGSKVTFTGRVKSVPRGTKVKLQQRSGRTWRTVTTVKTGSGGRFSVGRVVTGRGEASYRAYAAKRRTSPASSTVQITVLRRVSVLLRADPIAEQGTPVGLRVSTTPAQAGGPVQLQTRTGAGAWRAAGTATLTSAGTGTFRPAPTTTGLVQYRVVKPRHGYDAASTSAPTPVLVRAKRTTFGELMSPGSTEVVDPSVASWSFLSQPPSWWSRNAEIRWDEPGAFTPSLTPEPVGAYRSAAPPSTFDPSQGAEFNSGNSSLQTADVSFRATGTSFAIRYRTFATSTAMVWIDGHPVTATPIPGVAPPYDGQLNWIQITLPSPRTVHVRFAGSDHFFGVDHDEDVPLTVTAAPYPVTLGVISDSYFDAGLPFRTYEGSAAAVLHTRTGFRIWNLAQGGTGYLNDGTGQQRTGNAGYPGHYASPFGSDARIARVRDAPIDALLVNGSINDAWFDDDEYADAVNAFLDRVARVRPGLPVVIVGIEPVKVVADAPEYFADLHAKNQLLRSIAAQHRNVVGFINPFDEHWLTGTGSTTAPKGDGNQDQYVADDHIHLSPAGQTYYQDLIADRLASMPASLLTPVA